MPSPPEHTVDSDETVRALVLQEWRRHDSQPLPKRVLTEGCNMGAVCGFVIEQFRKQFTFGAIRGKGHLPPSCAGDYSEILVMSFPISVHFSVSFGLSIPFPGEHARHNFCCDACRKPIFNVCICFRCLRRPFFNPKFSFQTLLNNWYCPFHRGTDCVGVFFSNALLDIDHRFPEQLNADRFIHMDRYSLFYNALRCDIHANTAPPCV